MLNEAKIINDLYTAFPEYIGDDAAVIRNLDKQSYVVTKDLLVEGIHFRQSYVDPISLAHKALHVNLSDIAAMGAKAQFALLGVSIPLSHEDYANAFLQSFAQACKVASIILIGGDTTRSPDKFFVSITVIGIAQLTNIKYRHTAQLGDLICVAGNLGYAHIGLVALESLRKGFELFKNAFLKPVAKSTEGIWLGEHTGIHSVIDISDGLFIDLKRLCESSGVAAEVNLDRLRNHHSFSVSCELMGLEPLTTILTGGEDYSLLFTIDRNEYPTLSKQFKAIFGYSLKSIGLITRGNGVSFIENGALKELSLKPFKHFGELS